MKANILLVISTCIMSLHPYLSISQTRPSEVKELSNLLTTDYRLVKAFMGNELQYEIRIDTIKFELVKINSYPNQVIRFSFDSKKRCDSIIFINYFQVINMDGTPTDSSPPDTTLLLFDYRLGEQQPINRQAYRFRGGMFSLYDTHYYGYDEHNRLLLTLQSEGVAQFLYRYNDSDQISEEYYNGRQVAQYEYDEDIGIKVRNSTNQIIGYHYNKDGLIKKTVYKGNQTKTITYEYKK